jgi:hypothetical protein
MSCSENNDLTTRHNKRKYNSISSPKHRENNDLTTRHNKRKYNSMSSPKHIENNDLVVVFSVFRR